MKNRTKRWLSALLAMSMSFSALPLEAGAAFWDNIGSWLSPPSQEEMEQGKETLDQLKQKVEEEAQKLREQAETKLKEQLGDLYESYTKLQSTDFSTITVALTVKAEGLGEADSVTATLSGGEFSETVTLNQENSWTVTKQVPLFSGKLSVENGELTVPQVIQYSVTGSDVEGYTTPSKQDFVLDVDWTDVKENWTPAASATLSYSAKQSADLPTGEDPGGAAPTEDPTQGGAQQETTEFTAEIHWKNEVPLWLHPSVEVQLLAGNQSYGEAVELNLLNGWSYTWKDLPRHSESEEPIVYKIEEPVIEGYTVDSANGIGSEGGVITATLLTEPTVPLDAAVLWEHGENEAPPTSMTLLWGDERIELDGTDRSAVWYFDTAAKLPLLDGQKPADYSKAISAEEIKSYESKVLTLPWYSAGEETVEELKSQLTGLSLSELEELAGLGELPQTYAEGRELRWLTIVVNRYEAPPQDETPEVEPPQEPVTVTVPLDVLTIWNDRGSESLRPSEVSYALVKNEAEQYQKTVPVGESRYVDYHKEILTVSDTVENVLSLELEQSFQNMKYYDRELLLVPVPSGGANIAELALMSVENLRSWAAQQSADEDADFRLLAIAINSRQASGDLIVRKDVQDIDHQNLSDNTKFTYQVSLIYPDLSSETQTVEISEKEPLYLEDLPVGTHYSVLEKGRYGYINEDTDCLQSGVITEGSNELCFVNLKFNLIVRMDWTNSISWLQDDVRVYVADNKYTLGVDNLWTEMDYAYGISDLRYRDLAVRGLAEGFEEDYSIRWKNHVAIVTVSAEYNYDYEVEEDWKETAEDDEYRVLAKVVWVGGSEESRPSVSTQLYRDGKAYRDTATIKASKNSLRNWRYVWEDVKGDEDNDWNVKVTKVPAGYSCEVTKVKDNYFIITCTWNDTKENVYTGA